MFVLLPSAWAVSYPETASQRIHQAVIPGREAEGKGGRRMLGLQTGSWSNITNIHAGAVGSHGVGWRPSCDAGPQSQLRAGSCWQELTPWAAAGEEIPALTSGVWCQTRGLPRPCLSTQEVHSEEETPLLEQPPPFCQAEGGKRGPAWPFHTCHSPWSEIWITEANCKTNGLLCPSPLFVALHYNDYSWLPWTVQAVKGGQLCFYNNCFTQSKYRDTQLPNFLLKKPLEAQSRRMLEKKVKERGMHK